MKNRVSGGIGHHNRPRELPSMPTLDRDAALGALRRPVAIVRSNAGQPRRAANFRLARWSAGNYGGFDRTDLRMVDRAIADDILTVARPKFRKLVAGWRPQLVAPPAADHPWAGGPWLTRGAAGGPRSLPLHQRV